MAGIIGRSRAIARSRKEVPIVDNYVTFLSRIEEAQASMRSKADQNRRRAQLFSARLTTTEESQIAWEKRLDMVKLTIELYEGEPKGLDALEHLHRTATSMLTVYTTRTATLNAQIKQLLDQEAPLISHINQLSAAKAKLHSAQALEQSKGQLDYILATNTSVVHQGIPVRDDQALRAIRLLIAESEALVELKG